MMKFNREKKHCNIHMAPASHGVYKGLLQKTVASISSYAEMLCELIGVLLKEHLLGFVISYMLHPIQHQ